MKYKRPKSRLRHELVDLALSLRHLPTPEQWRYFLITIIEHAEKPSSQKQAFVRASEIAKKRGVPWATSPESMEKSYFIGRKIWSYDKAIARIEREDPEFIAKMRAEGSPVLENPISRRRKGRRRRRSQYGKK
jgi:hypothetical protein